MENIQKTERNSDFDQGSRNFVVENYPAKESGLEIDDLLSQALDGFEVVEKRDSNHEIESLISYSFEKDSENEKYCRLGIILTREESRGEGIAGELFSKLKTIAEKNDCDYFTAVADTEEGEEALLSLGFYEHFDPINKKNYYRLDL